MSLSYERLKPKRFPKKSYKHSLESRYWKRFETVPLEKPEGGAEETMQRSEIAFCHGPQANLMATAVSARVDIYRLT